VFENRVLRRIFEPKKEEVAGGWRRLHNERVQKFNICIVFSVSDVFNCGTHLRAPVPSRPPALCGIRTRVRIVVGL
jgi:hypothetical protein